MSANRDAEEKPNGCLTAGVRGMRSLTGVRAHSAVAQWSLRTPYAAGRHTPFRHTWALGGCDAQRDERGDEAFPDGISAGAAADVVWGKLQTGNVGG